MGTVDYRDALRAVLDPVSQSTASRLSVIHRSATAGVDGVLIDVFLDQDAEGPFGVWARFEGADAFSLDRRLGDDRELFSVIWGEEGWEPPVPPRPAEWSEANWKMPSSKSWPNGSTRSSRRDRLTCVGRS